MKTLPDGTVEPEAGDIIWCDKDGTMHVRAPNRWDKAKWDYIYPVLRVVLFPVRLVHEGYWALVWWWRRNRA